MLVEEKVKVVLVEWHMLNEGEERTYLYWIFELETGTIPCPPAEKQIEAYIL